MNASEVFAYIATAKCCVRCGGIGNRHFKDADTKDGLDCYCSDCRRAKTRAARHKTPEYWTLVKAAQRRYYYKQKVRTILGETHAALRNAR